MKDLFIVLTFVLAAAIGCSSGSNDGKCVGKVNFEGRTYEGKAKTADQAKANACNNYCRDADSEYEAFYRVWLDSPKGKAAGSPSKQEAIFKDKDLMEFVTVTCANKLREGKEYGSDLQVIIASRSCAR